MDLQFVPVNRTDVPKRTRAGGDGATATFVANFLASDVEVAAIPVPDGAKLESIRATLGNFLRRQELPARVFTRSKALFIESGEEHTIAHKNANAKAAAKAATTA